MEKLQCSSPSHSVEKKFLLGHLIFFFFFQHGTECNGGVLSLNMDKYKHVSYSTIYGHRRDRYEKFKSRYIYKNPWAVFLQLYRFFTISDNLRYLLIVSCSHLQEPWTLWLLKMVLALPLPFSKYSNLFFPYLYNYSHLWCGCNLFNFSFLTIFTPLSSFVGA